MSADHDRYDDHIVGVDGFDQTQAEALERIRHANGFVLVTSIPDGDALTFQVLALIPPDLAQQFAVFLAGITIRISERGPE